MIDKSSMTIGCAILAGGKSVRMQCNKALLTLDGVTYLQRIAAELSCFDERLLSTNDPALSDLIGFRPVADIFTDHGPMGGIYSTLSAAESDAIFFVPCDLPFFTGKIAAYLCGQMTPDDLGVIAVDSTGRLQPLCAIYSKAILPVLRQNLTEHKCKMRPLLSHPGFRRIELPTQIAEPINFHNVNTPQDIP